jgi:hypothetical protein
MKNSMQYLHSAIVSGLLAVLVFTQTASTQTAFAQEPSAQPAQQATQQATPATQQTPAPIERIPAITTPNGATAVPAAYSSPEAAAQVRLNNAHNLLIVNDGVDDAFPASGPNAYLDFVSGMKAWGRYNIVTEASQADLVIHFRAATTTTVVDGTSDAPQASIYYHPYFKITITDPQTLQPIWPITVPVATGRQKKTGTDLFQLSIENCVSQLKLLVDQPLTPQETAALTATRSYGRAHSGWVVVGVVGGMAGAAVLTGFLMHNAFENAVNQQNQQQQQFCQQNHIPNCP